MGWAGCFALVGFSWGGTIACHIVARAPDRVTALVLVDTGYGAPPRPESYEELLEQERAESEEKRFPDRHAFPPPRTRTSARITDEPLLASMRVEEGLLVAELTLGVYAAAMHGVQAEPPQPLLGNLGEVELPGLLLVAGRPPREDREAEVDAFQQVVPQADVRHFPEAGHGVLIDAGDEAIPAVGEWLLRTLT